LQLLVFSVTPFKIDQNKTQNSSIDKFQNLEKKEGKYAKTLAKSKVTAIFLMQDKRINFLWRRHAGAPAWRPEKKNRNICH